MSTRFEPFLRLGNASLQHECGERVEELECEGGGGYEADDEEHAGAGANNAPTTLPLWSLIAEKVHKK